MKSESSLVEEVRQRRAAISSQFEDNLDRYGQHLQEVQQRYRNRLVSQVTVVPARSDASQTKPNT